MILTFFVKPFLFTYVKHEDRCLSLCTGDEKANQVFIMLCHIQQQLY